MAKNDEQKADPQDMTTLIVDALKNMPQEQLRAILQSAGAIPTTMGMTAEAMQVLMGGLTANSAEAMKQALRSQRKENPNYHERSVFHPEGVYQDDGTAKPAKVKLRVPTKYCGVRLGGELETEDEILLLNSIRESKTAREGLWTAEIVNANTMRERLIIDLPVKSLDERMSLPSMSLVLRELISGPAAVNTESMLKKMDEMAKQIEALKAAQQPAGAAA